ncbi:MAG: hypothetical protein GY730_10705 [bacterium]|nr:hypothetical protein [bacterium]
MTIKQYTLTIELDAGISSAYIINKKGDLVSSGSQSYNPVTLKNGYIEYDALEIIYTVRSAIIHAFKNRVTPSSISFIHIIASKPSCLIWNKQTGLPLHNAIAYPCKRTLAVCNNLSRSPVKDKIRKLTGLHIKPEYTATKIKWLLENIKNISRNSREMYAGTVASWLLFNLTGKKVFASDYTNAAKTLLFNIKNLKWDPFLLKEFSVPGHILPEIKPSSSLFGETSKFVSLPDGVPVTCMTTKNQACLIGANSLRFGENYINYSNPGYIIINTGKELLFPEKPFNSTLISIKNDIRYAIEGHIHFPIKILQLMTPPNSDLKNREIENSLMDLDDNEVAVIPTQNRNSYLDSETIKNNIIGIKEDTTLVHIIKATLESIAFKIKYLLDIIEDKNGVFLKEIKATGYLLNLFLTQFQSDILQIPVQKINKHTMFISEQLLYDSLNGTPSENIRKNQKDHKLTLPSMDPITSIALYNQWKELSNISYN